MQPIGAPPPSTACSRDAGHGAFGVADPLSASYLGRRSATSVCRSPWTRFASGWNAMVAAPPAVRDCDDPP